MLQRWEEKFERQVIFKTPLAVYTAYIYDLVN